MSNELIERHLLPPIYTKRLRIREIELRDEEAIFNIRSAPDHFKFVDVPSYENIERAREFVKNVLEDIDEGSVFFWVLELEGTHEVIGTVCLWSFSDDRKKAEVGYEVLAAHQGNGYADEALKAIIKFAKNELMLTTLDAITHEDHIASKSILNHNEFKEMGYIKKLDPETEEGPNMKLFRKEL